MRVLFVCTGNYYRSRFAEAVFNHHAALEARVSRAFSRGLEISLVAGEGDLSSFARAALLERGIARDCTHAMPTSLSLRDLEAADRTIVLDEHEHRPMMEEQFPEWENRVEYWQIADVDRREAHDALAEIEQRVRAMVVTLP